VFREHESAAAGRIGVNSDLCRQHPADAGEGGTYQGPRSYSLGNIVLANIGNVIYAAYVLSLPLGPVWALHGFHLGATGLMLFWYLRHGRRLRARHEPTLASRGRRGSQMAVARRNIRRFGRRVRSATSLNAR